MKRTIIVALSILAAMILCGCDQPEGGSVFALEPLMIGVSPIGPDGFSQLNRGMNVPADSEEFVDQAIEMIEAGATVVNVLPLSYRPTSRDDFFDLTRVGYETICYEIRQTYLHTRFIWDLTAAEDIDELYELTKGDPYFALHSVFIGDTWVNQQVYDEKPMDDMLWQFWSDRDKEIKPLPVINQESNITRFQEIWKEWDFYLPQYVQMWFTGGLALEPTAANYYMVRAQLPKYTTGAIVVCEGDNWKEICDAAIENGDHVMVGLHYSEAEESNVSFVRYCVEKAKEIGRPVANFKQTVAQLGVFR